MSTSSCIFVKHTENTGMFTSMHMLIHCGPDMQAITQHGVARHFRASRQQTACHMTVLKNGPPSSSLQLKVSATKILPCKRSMPETDLPTLALATQR